MEGSAVFQNRIRKEIIKGKIKDQKKKHLAISLLR
jgi:hypothetical protein